ncbi:uncharacterized protein MYCFIDRAFT_79968 [Pseudocercospora fijiensis CIRAD86]|uniref:Uncharacterized protein n=1 Tax=Pseudocercospora fijiensis (strain CIRAD86) TaxID=383855 RepID=M3A852_PSEFD|nr:uncharacterized protein MYCFIDRAFT_79968 [Pseudocercospora fijiensis CIRAD86]EME80771.1 hypothetical protein MYCFIDRAFT_79968 [Pseudocercospora fijiensis CIRAD86]
MDQRECVKVEFDRDENYGWVDLGDHDQLHNSRFLRPSMTESAPNEIRIEASHEPDESASPGSPASVAVSNLHESSIAGPTPELVKWSNHEDLKASITKNRADLEQMMQNSETDRAQLWKHVQSLRQELSERGDQQELTLREMELRFKRRVQAQGDELSVLKSQLQTHAELKEVLQRIQGQNTFVLESTRAEISAELNQLTHKMSAIEQELEDSVDQKFSTRAADIEIALRHERSVQIYGERRLAENLQDLKTSTENAIETERVRNERAVATMTTEVEHVNTNVGDALRSLKAEIDDKGDALAANIDRAFDECRRIENASQKESSKRTKDLQALEARLKEMEQRHTKDMSVLT